MKTIYCLRRSPQFKLPCVKYNYLLKEKEYKIDDLSSKPKINIDFNEYETEEIKNMDDHEKKEIVNQILDKLYPKMGIKRCMQINRNNKIKLKKFLKNFKKSFLNKKNIFKKGNNEPSNKRYQSIDYNNSKLNTNYNTESKNNIKNNNKSLNNYKNNYLSNSSRNKFSNLSHKSFKYNYPIIDDEENTEYISQLLNSNYLNNNGNMISNSIDSYKNKVKKSLKMAYSSLNTINFRKKRNIDIKLITPNKKHKDLFEKKYLGNIFGDTIEKIKRKKLETQDNELNLIYSENKEQFDRKYDKYRKQENLKGLGLANINYPPKIKFKDLEKQIGIIKRKVINVKSIVDDTFPKVLAYLTWAKKDYENSLKKKGFDTPYKERLNMLKKHQKYVNLYLSDPIEIISERKNNS